MHYLIYKITNKLNNKFYVGKHATLNENDDYMGSGELIGRAIKKYGKEQFIKEILFDLSTKEEMNQKEIDIVDEEFVARPDTYNIKLGGEGGWNNEDQKKGPEAFKKRYSEDEEFRLAQIEKNRRCLEYFRSNFSHPWIGRKHSDETKKKMSEAKLGRCDGKNNPAFGSHWINDGIKNIRIYHSTPMPDGFVRGRLMKQKTS
jgi:group I intron endonuclease